MSRDRLLQCSFGRWYPVFRGCTVRSVVLPMPEGFVKFLHADGLVLPSEDDSENDVDDSSPAQVFGFLEFEKSVKAAIKELGGAVLPKLNWSSPKDATWISYDNSMRCTSLSDVYMLLKSSDFVAHDLIQLDDRKSETAGSIPHELVLRRWYNVNPAAEFRCFVRDSELIALCQRSYTDYYPYIAQERSAILHDVLAFFDQKICGRFPDTHYTFDVYRKAENKVWLIDFNPYSEVTDSLLYTWAELCDTAWPPSESKDEVPVFRFIESQEGIAASQYHRYAFPCDLTDLASGEDTAKLLDLLTLGRSQAESDDEEHVDGAFHQSDDALS